MSHTRGLVIGFLLYISVAFGIGCANFPSITVISGSCGSGADESFQLLQISAPLNVETTSNWTAVLANITLYVTSRSCHCN